MVSSWGQRIRGLLPQRGATEDPEPRAFFPGETRGGADVPVAERACPGRHHPRRPRRRQARSMGPPCVRTLSLELQQNNMHVQINGNERLRQSIMMFLD
jgi:hypothetical protein